MPRINLPYGDSSFDSNDLITYLNNKKSKFIIQGQQACARAYHTKPKSLDFWIRDNYARNPDTMQAVNKVVEDLVTTGKFIEGDFICPDSGRRCKGIKLVYS